MLFIFADLKLVNIKFGIKRVDESFLFRTVFVIFYGLIIVFSYFKANIYLELKYKGNY